MHGGRAVVAGDLDDWPFSSLHGHESRGLFRAEAQLVDAVVKFQPDWPAAEHLSGDGGGGGERLLRGALERGAIIPLAGLSAAIVETSSPRAALAYAEALSVVSTIAERSGAYTLRRILDFIDAGDGVDAALRKAIALDLAGLEELWLEALRDRYGIRS